MAFICDCQTGRPERKQKSMRRLPPPLRWLLLLLAQHAVPSLAELTAQEAHECRANPELIAFELRGGWVLEIAAMFCVALFMYVLIEEYYVPALELICTKEVLNIPKPIMGCTIMAAGNCLPELSISLMSILANGQDIGTGEVLGSCVFDLLAMLGVVCIKLPKEGAHMPLPLVLYFLAWVVIATTTDLLLFFTTAEITWRLASSTLTLNPTLALACLSSPPRRPSGSSKHSPHPYHNP